MPRELTREEAEDLRWGPIDGLRRDGERRRPRRTLVQRTYFAGGLFEVVIEDRGPATRRGRTTAPSPDFEGIEPERCASCGVPKDIGPDGRCNGCGHS